MTGFVQSFLIQVIKLQKATTVTIVCAKKPTRSPMNTVSPKPRKSLLIVQTLVIRSTYSATRIARRLIMISLLCVPVKRDAQTDAPVKATIASIVWKL